MKWYAFAVFFVSTLTFYLLGNRDGESRNINGLIIWLVTNGTVLIWLIATWWATR